MQTPEPTVNKLHPEEINNWLTTAFNLAEKLTNIFVSCRNSVMQYIYKQNYKKIAKIKAMFDYITSESPKCMKRLVFYGGIVLCRLYKSGQLLSR